jgi:hypothetical protein
MTALQAWVFLRRGSDHTNYGEVRYLLSTDPVLTGTGFDPGWVRVIEMDVSTAATIPSFSGDADLAGGEA